MAAPRASARGGIIRSNSSFDFRPRPPETTRSAVASSGRSLLARSSDTQVTWLSILGSTPSSTAAEPPSLVVFAKAVARTVMTLMESVDWTVRGASKSLCRKIYYVTRTSSNPMLGSVCGQQAEFGLTPSTDELPFVFFTRTDDAVEFTLTRVPK